MLRLKRHPPLDRDTEELWNPPLVAAYCRWMVLEAQAPIEQLLPRLHLPPAAADKGQRATKSEGKTDSS
jgi:hypothetical protein